MDTEALINNIEEAMKTDKSPSTAEMCMELIDKHIPDLEHRIRDNEYIIIHGNMPEIDWCQYYGDETLYAIQSQRYQQAKEEFENIKANPDRYKQFKKPYEENIKKYQEEYQKLQELKYQLWTFSTGGLVKIICGKES